MIRVPSFLLKNIIKKPYMCEYITYQYMCEFIIFLMSLDFIDEFRFFLIFFCKKVSGEDDI